MSLTLQLSDIMDSQPSEAQLMKDALFQLTSLDSSVEEKVKALQALQILVEPIDNANGGLCGCRVACIYICGQGETGHEKSSSRTRDGQHAHTCCH